MVKVVNMRFLLAGSIALYGLYFVLIARQAEMTKYKVGISKKFESFSSHFQEEPVK
jgi:hypothetical protein